ncbi:MAG: Lrp/AsnC family transcriptional regulator [Sphingomonas sp.]|nr:Lrp/AsnC family transcriptional regulator [Sphingomonas sp.]MDX3885924.1 Lrp/AsnC family transcriptional regulator [Sphingomonas sp.]
MDRIDHQLLALLEADARLSFADLAERTGLTKTPCWKRVQALEQAGAIRGYRAAIDAAALGLATSAFVRVIVAFDRHDAFEAAVIRHPMILACHATVGETDYLLHVLARDLAALDDFLRGQLWRLPGVERFTTTIATREIKAAGSITACAVETPTL